MNLDWHTNSIYLWFTSEINEWNIKKSINIIFMSWKPKFAEIETKMPNITKIILINQNSILLNRGFWGGESNQNGKWKHFHNIELIHKYPFHLINSKGTTKKCHICVEMFASGKDEKNDEKCVTTFIRFPLCGRRYYSFPTTAIANRKYSISWLSLNASK